MPLIFSYLTRFPSRFSHNLTFVQKHLKKMLIFKFLGISNYYLFFYLIYYFIFVDRMKLLVGFQKSLSEEVKYEVVTLIFLIDLIC
jgi:hypothetical protein